MKRVASILALTLTLGAVVSATYSQVRLTQLGVSGDKYKVSLFADSNQTDWIASKTKTWDVVSPYYDSGCTCYHVPLSVLGFTQNQINQAVSATGQRIIGGVTPMESIVQILD